MSRRYHYEEMSPDEFRGYLEDTASGWQDGYRFAKLFGFDPWPGTNLAYSGHLRHAGRIAPGGDSDSCRVCRCSGDDEGVNRHRSEQQVRWRPGVAKA
jgi:hypothetical protein